MLKIIFGFLPWILYFILVGATRQQHLVAIAAALITTLALDFNQLKKGFILTWGTLIFFVLLLAATLLVSSNWPEVHANLLANSALAVIAWFSLAINKPFTLQYAREQVAEEFWQSPSFMRINQIITAVWATSFLIAISLNVLRLYSVTMDAWLYQTLSYAPSIFAIWFTKNFPDWYRQRRTNKLIQQSEESQKSNPFLAGNFAPVSDELNIENLIVEGELPKDLQGIYMRNGPNPAFPPFTYTYPFDGDGMLHALYFKDGKVSYKNRFIETDQLQVERRVGKAVYGGLGCPFIRDSKLLKPTDPTMPVKLGRFIHIIRHAGLYLALHESTSAYEVDAQLNTLGEWNPARAKSAIEVNAHTRLDPQTGELYFIAYHSDKPIITYHVLDKNAKLTNSGFIDAPHTRMIHDFVLTKNYIAIFLCPVIIDYAGFIRGKPFVDWRPELNTRIAIVSRANLNNVTWIETEAFFTYHFANAHEMGDEIIIDHVRYPTFNMDAKNLLPAHLYQTIINPAQKRCDHKQLDDREIEFPRINENHNSNSYRYVYTPANLAKNKNSGDLYHALIKYDLKTGNSTTHDFGANCEIGEAVFAPRVNSHEEDDGYVMLFIYNKKENNSDFVILNGQDLASKPIATIKLPRRVPHGLHGSWMPVI
jgi:carotenoid cleavage dioxygenase-like enzyme